jgi:hypothetical protein
MPGFSRLVAAGFALVAIASQAGAVPGFPSLYQSKASTVCNSQTQCAVSFDRVPRNRLLKATNINCIAIPTVTNPAKIEQVTFALVAGSLSSPDPFDFRCISCS